MWGLGVQLVPLRSQGRLKPAGTDPAVGVSRGPVLEGTALPNTFAPLAVTRTSGSGAPKTGSRLASRLRLRTPSASGARHSASAVKRPFGKKAGTVEGSSNCGRLMNLVARRHGFGRRGDLASSDSSPWRFVPMSIRPRLSGWEADHRQQLEWCGESVIRVRGLDSQLLGRLIRLQGCNLRFEEGQNQGSDRVFFTVSGRNGRYNPCSEPGSAIKPQPCYVEAIGGSARVSRRNCTRA